MVFEWFSRRFEQGSKALQIIPVLDLMDGLVVRAVAGQRSAYRPIASRLAKDPQPATVGRAFIGLGLAQAYVADLDAIAGAEPAWHVYEMLTDIGLQLWIDAGVGTHERAGQMRQFAAGVPGVTGVVIGLESLGDPLALAQVAEIVGPARAIFSLDLKAGRPLAAESWGSISAEAIVALAAGCGIGRVIVLDLAQVGTAGGVGTIGLCRALAARFPAIQLIAGGGVRGPADLDELAAAGCSGALVASALHDGQLTAADCRNWSGL